MVRQKHHERVAFETSQKKARSLTIQEAVDSKSEPSNSVIHSDLFFVLFPKMKAGFSNMIYG